MKTVCGIILFVFIIEIVNGSSLQQCLNKDSISCIQIQIYKTAKSFFDKSNVEVVGGVTVTNNHERQGKSLKETETEQRIMLAKHVEDRQIALDDYVAKQVKHLWNNGSVSWNPTQMTRSLVETLAVNIIPETSNRPEEGRGKEKKQLKMLLPLLIGIKLKMASFVALAYMGIALIAKKAVLAGLISLLVSGFIATKNLIESHKMQGGMTSYHSGWEAQTPIWQSASASNTQLYEHDVVAMNSNLPQQAAYGGGKNERIYRN